MRDVQRLLALFAMIFCWSVIAVSPTHAASMDITSFTSMSGDCQSSVTMLHNFTITGDTIDITAPDRDVIALVLYDAYGDAFAYIGISVGVGFSGTIPNHPWNYPYLAQPQSRPFKMVIYDNTSVVTTASADLAGAQHGTILDVVYYDPATYGVCTSLPYLTPSESLLILPPFSDGRLNNWDTASPVVVYGQDYESGRGLIIYSDTGEVLLLVYPEELIACPEENTLILERNGIRLYRLSSCEYQLMTVSLDGAKTYVFVFNDLYENTGYFSYEE